MSSGNNWAYSNGQQLNLDGLGWLSPGEWNKPLEVRKPKCECGTSITLGTDDHPSFHSDWCEIRKEWELDERWRRAQESLKK